ITPSRPAPVVVLIKCPLPVNTRSLIVILKGKSKVKGQKSKVESGAIREVCWCSGRVRLRRMSISAWSSKIQPMPTLAKLQLQLQLLPLYKVIQDVEERSAKPNMT